MDGRMRVAARATRKDMSSFLWMISDVNDVNDQNLESRYSVGR